MRRAPISDPTTLLEKLESRQLLNADLIASGIVAFPQMVSIGEEFSATATFRNGGGDSAGPFAIGVRLSRDRVWGNDDDIVVGTLQRGVGLNGFEIDTETESFTVPSGAEPGWYYIGMEVDTNNAVLESSESNNRVFSGARLIRIEGVVGGEIEVRGDNQVIFDGDINLPSAI